VSPRASLDDVDKRKFLTLLGLELRPPDHRPKCRWKNNFKMYLKAIGRDSVNWIQLAQDSVQSRALFFFFKDIGHWPFSNLKNMSFRLAVGRPTLQYPLGL
jgi:hypothetical protein